MPILHRPAGMARHAGMGWKVVAGMRPCPVCMTSRPEFTGGA